MLLEMSGAHEAVQTVPSTVVPASDATVSTDGGNDTAAVANGTSGCSFVC